MTEQLNGEPRTAPTRRELNPCIYKRPGEVMFARRETAYRWAERWAADLGPFIVRHCPKCDEWHVRRNNRKVNP